MRNLGNENIRIVANLLFLAVLAALFVVRYVSWSRSLKVLKATLQNYGRLYILDVRAQPGVRDASPIIPSISSFLYFS